MTYLLPYLISLRNIVSSFSEYRCDGRSMHQRAPIASRATDGRQGGTSGVRLVFAENRIQIRQDGSKCQPSRHEVLACCGGLLG